MAEEKKKTNYLSSSESKKILRYNLKQMKYYEKEKRRKKDPSEYLTHMKDDANLIEIDGLETCFFTDNGTVKSVNNVSFEIPKNKFPALETIK